MNNALDEAERRQKGKQLFLIGKAAGWCVIPGLPMVPGRTTWIELTQHEIENHIDTLSGSVLAQWGIDCLDWWENENDPA